MGITIPDEELELCAQLMRPAWIAAGLTNDLFSWEKEYEAAKRNHQPDVANAIWVLMGEHLITADQAKDLCREKIKIAVADYLQIIKKSCNNTKISLDLRRYIEAMQYSLSGNVVWSLQCPRYHPEAQYNEFQLLRMKHGLTAHPKVHVPLDTALSGAEVDTSDSEESLRPRKRVRTSGFLSPPTPVSEARDADNSSLYRNKDIKGVDGHNLAAWATAASVSPVGTTPTGNKHTDAESVVVALNLPEVGDEVCQSSSRSGPLCRGALLTDRRVNRLCQLHSNT
jgi:Terpene synthase family 2, C-terminal metal binding